ncbi:McrC family protein [Psychrobacter immobilis]|uniref:McrC family protein n=1 Tax=Psychrobacter immobilis TaxID=498 RepID=UPI00191B459D|nr:hypothetical protein [Psychrobacter immobilis]
MSRVLQSDVNVIGANVTGVNHASNANTANVNAVNAKTLDTHTITVFEHQRLTAHDFVQVSDFQWLMAQEFSVFSIKRKHRQWQLKVGHYIGVILLPSGMTLEILPKLMAKDVAHHVQHHAYKSDQPSDDIQQTRHWVQAMLSDLVNSHEHSHSKLPNTKNLGQLSNQLTALPLAALPLSDWLIEQFLKGLAQYQPTKHYQTQIDNQATLQGRLLIKEQLRRNSVQPHKFVCERSVLSQDMLSNRLIKSALVWLAPLLQTAMPPKSIQLWQQVRALNYHERQRLESVYQQAKRQLALQPLSQLQAQAAQQLLELAYWLLQRSDIQTGNGIAASLSSQPLSRPRLCLLIDMNQAFEQWASLRIASMFEQLNKNYQALHQAQSVWLNDAEGQACLSIRPDLLIYQTPNDDIREEKNARKHPYDNNQSTASAKETRNYSHVIDIKWKYLSHSGALSASDAYQLTSYAQAYQAGQVWLVYPVQGNVRQPVALRQQIHGSGDANSHNSNSAKLWLMPFDVLSGTLNGELPQEL